MESEELEDLKDRVLWEIQMEGKNSEELRQEMYEKLGRTLRGMTLNGNLEEARDNIEAALELDEYLKREGLKKAED